MPGRSVVRADLAAAFDCEPGPAQTHGHALPDLSISARGDVALQVGEFVGVLPEATEDDRNLLGGPGVGDFAARSAFALGGVDALGQGIPCLVETLLPLEFCDRRLEEGPVLTINGSSNAAGLFERFARRLLGFLARPLGLAISGVCISLSALCSAILLGLTVAGNITVTRDRQVPSSLRAQIRADTVATLPRPTAPIPGPL